MPRRSAVQEHWSETGGTGPAPLPATTDLAAVVVPVDAAAAAAAVPDGEAAPSIQRGAAAGARLAPGPELAAVAAVARDGSRQRPWRLAVAIHVAEVKEPLQGHRSQFEAVVRVAAPPAVRPVVRDALARRRQLDVLSRLRAAAAAARPAVPSVSRRAGRHRPAGVGGLLIGPPAVAAERARDPRECARPATGSLPA